MKVIKKKSLLQSFILSKLCTGSAISYIDHSNFNFLIGYRQSLFSLINPFSFQYSLKTSFLFLESFIKNNYDFIFIVNIKDSILFKKFYQLCNKKKY
jgi:hypothetical protein